MHCLFPLKNKFIGNMLFPFGLHLLIREQKIGANFGKSNLTCQNREAHHRLQSLKKESPLPCVVDHNSERWRRNCFGVLPRLIDLPLRKATKALQNDAPYQRLVGGSRRVRSGAEPSDQSEIEAVSRRSPRSADPGSNNWNSWTPPPGWIDERRRCIRSH